MQESVPVGAAEGRPLEGSTTTTVQAGFTGALADPRALQILSTEHWSLLAGRSLAYNEAFSRAGMFLTFLSASLIVIGFVIGAQGLTTTVVPVALALLLADLFLGLATVGRLFSASSEELQCVRGMNRIRHAYREMVPGLEPYFITGFHDDALGVLATYGGSPATTSLASNIIHGLTTTPGMIATIDAMIVAAIAAVGVLGLGAALEIALAAAAAGFLAAFGVFLVVGHQAAMSGQEQSESRFPTPLDRTSR